MDYCELIFKINKCLVHFTCRKANNVKMSLFCKHCLKKKTQPQNHQQKTQQQQNPQDVKKKTKTKNPQNNPPDETPENAQMEH